LRVPVPIRITGTPSGQLRQLTDNREQPPPDRFRIARGTHQSLGIVEFFENGGQQFGAAYHVVEMPQLHHASA
jgi:hypothetical protein